MIRFFPKRTTAEAFVRKVFTIPQIDAMAEAAFNENCRITGNLIGFDQQNEITRDRYRRMVIAGLVGALYPDWKPS